MDEENNEIGEELNIDKIKSNLVNNVVPKLEEFGKSSRRNSNLMRPRYVLRRCTTNFSFGFIPRKTTSYKKLALSQLANRLYPKH